MRKQDLLIELGTEELPPKALKTLSDSFSSALLRQLQAAGFVHGKAQSFATPRRLALLVHDLPEVQPDKAVEKRGPALAAAFRDGKPTPAAEGFARSCGVTVDALATLEADKGSWLVFRATEKGDAIQSLIQGFIENALSELPIPKRMRWGARKVQFVRPAHWLVVLYGTETVPCQVLDQPSGNTTRGHRFHCEDVLTIPSPADYASLLRDKGKVIADFVARREMIREQTLAAASKAGGKPVWDDALLDEVTSLVEWPVALTGQFEARFLDVPQEALINTMQENQKYFPLVDSNDRLLNQFVFISNIESRHPEWVISGNEKVVRPRLADAEFFNRLDRSKALDAHNAACKTVVFQTALGTLHDKELRISELAGLIAEQIGGDPSLAHEAGRLAKADLASSMVYEFDALQGVMGRYLALHEGRPAELAQALEEQYLPRFATDALPTTRTGIALALADRIDTLVGIFGIGQRPTGDKDPFALRRASLAVLRIVIEQQLELDLLPLLERAAALYGSRLSEGSVVQDVNAFIQSRYRARYQEQGMSTEAIMSVEALNLTRPLDIDRRIHAVEQFRSDSAAEALAAANKRVGNILAKEAGIPTGVTESALVDDAEMALFRALLKASASAEKAVALNDYRAALAALATLRPDVDRFFDNVMVMVDDVTLRQNRLALLNMLRNSFLSIADISVLNP